MMVIRQRVEELTNEIEAALKGLGFTGPVGRQVVLTGGGAELKNIADYMQGVLGRAVRVGRPKQITGLPDAHSGPAFSTLVGLALLAASGRGDIRDIAGAGRPRAARQGHGRPADRGDEGRLLGGRLRVTLRASGEGAMVKAKETRKASSAGLWLTLLLAALVLLNYVDRGAVGIAAPKLKDELMLSATAFGIAVSAFSWIYAPAQFAVGWLSDRFCVYRMIAAGLAVWALATFLTGFANGLAMLVALRVMLGIGEGVAFPSASKIIARHVSARAARDRQQRRLPPRSPGAGARHFRRRPDSPLLRLAADLHHLRLGHLAVDRPVAARVAGRNGAATRNGSGNDVPVGQVMRNRTVWPMGIGHFCNTYGFYFLLAWLPCS